MKTQNNLDYGLRLAADQKGSACVSRAGLKASPLLRIRCSGVARKQSFHEFSIWAGNITQQKCAIARRARSRRRGTRGVRYPTTMNRPLQRFNASTLQPE